MSNEIKINNPHVVVAQIVYVSDIITEYQSVIKNELNEMSTIETAIEDATNNLNKRKAGLESSLNQMYKIQGQSDIARENIVKLKKELDKIDKHLKKMHYCYEEYLGIRRDVVELYKESVFMAETGKMLSTKIQQLINKVIEIF